jgi:large subunit ribosomal protein L24
MSTKKTKNPSKLRLGDEVLVISGAHKGESGTISGFNKEKTRVFIGGVNRVRRHQKPQPALGRPGGIIEKEASIHISNVAYETSKGATRLAYKLGDDGRKVRIARKTGEEIQTSA